MHRNALEQLLEVRQVAQLRVLHDGPAAELRLHLQRLGRVVYSTAPSPFQLKRSRV